MNITQKQILRVSKDIVTFYSEEADRLPTTSIVPAQFIEQLYTLASQYRHKLWGIQSLFPIGSREHLILEDAAIRITTLCDLSSDSFLKSLSHPNPDFEQEITGLEQTVFTLPGQSHGLTDTSGATVQ